ncbi:MAG: hypothetical protein M1834_001881 [Cirrosporium novae-zelandiae]|nr:MAG: hypothetical protein M1834_001881 [Cirrosporium novae-zelandiae]
MNNSRFLHSITRRSYNHVATRALPRTAWLSTIAPPVTRAIFNTTKTSFPSPCSLSSSLPRPIQSSQPCRYSSADSHASTPLSKTALYDEHVAHGAKMVPFAGYTMPLYYSDLSHAESHQWTREKASLFDVGHMVQHTFTGALALSFLSTITPASLSGLKPYTSTLSTLLHPKTGGIVDDTIITRIGPESFYVVTNAGCRDKDLAYLSARIKEFLASQPEVRTPAALQWDVISSNALLALQGPLAMEALQPLVPPTVDLKSLYFSHSLHTPLVLPSGEPSSEAALISRTGYTGEDGFEISLPFSFAVPFAQALLSNPSVKLVGLAARDSLRLEAGMCLYGHDLNDDITPVEAGLSWIIGKDRRTKDAGFHGAEVIASQLTPKKDGGSPPARRRVGLVVEGAPAREGATIGISKPDAPAPTAGKTPAEDSIEEIGHVTSGGPSISLPGTNIAMGYVRRGFQKSGTDVWVKVRKTWRKGTITKMPFVEAKYYKVSPTGLFNFDILVDSLNQCQEAGVLVVEEIFSENPEPVTRNGQVQPPVKETEDISLSESDNPSPEPVLLLAVQARPALKTRTDNGLALTPPMGWNSYNHYSCSPNETIIKSNAAALISLGLADVGYEYVTPDCGWTIPSRLENGSLTWNSSLFPSGFPALGEYIHNLGLKFGVYSDSGVQMCMTGGVDQAGSLYHEAEDAKTFADDNCYSDAASGYPNTNYAPSTSPAPRMYNMSQALLATGRDIVFAICEWGVDYPTAWAPSMGNTWRVTNDIIPYWKTIWRILNQIVPQTAAASSGQWLDLDMLEVGNDIFTEAEEQTHFSLWSIIKSPLVIGSALKDEYTAISDTSLAILKNEDVISYNQDSLGEAAKFQKRYTEDGYEVWSGDLSDDRVVAALINWQDSERDLTLTLPDIGLQTAGSLKNIWLDTSASDVLTTYTASVPAHGTMLLELADTTAAGEYSADQFATTSGKTTRFSKIYGITTSSSYSITIAFTSSLSDSSTITLGTSASSDTATSTLAAGSKSLTSTITLQASTNNTVTITHPTDLTVSSISITAPDGTYYAASSFTLSGNAVLDTCEAGLCHPTGTKVGYVSPSGSATISITRNSTSNESSSTVSKYIWLDYTNNDIAFSTAWNDGTNTRNLTIKVNDAETTRVELPLSGHSSELFSPENGWQDSGTFGVLVGGFGTGSGSDTIVVSNEGGSAGVESYGADFVGFKILG